MRRRRAEVVMAHITVPIREYAGDTREFAADSRGFAEDSRRIRERIRDGFAKVRDGYANSRIEFARIRESSRGFTRIRDQYANSRGFARSSRRIRKFADREDSRPVNDSSPSLIRVGVWLGSLLSFTVLGFQCRCPSSASVWQSVCHNAVERHSRAGEGSMLDDGQG